jgi:hypothetical protein
MYSLKEKKVAEYAKGVWESLGFEVSLNPLSVEAYEKALYETGKYLLSVYGVLEA